MDNLIKGLKVGQKIKVGVEASTVPKKVKKTISGQIIFKNKYFLTLDTGEYKTAIMLADFLNGSAILQKSAV